MASGKPPGCSVTSAIARGQLVPQTARCRQGRATPDGAKPRFVVNSLKHARMADPRALYEDLYCTRGEAENRIGEQFELFADRAREELLWTVNPA